MQKQGENAGGVAVGSGVLDPADRFSEIIFGLLMVLSITGSVSVATAGRGEVRTLLIAAIGCNTAWGIVDAVMYVMGNLVERSRALSLYKAVRDSRGAGRAAGLIRDALPGGMGSAMTPSDLESLREMIDRLPEPPRRAHINRDDIAGAIAVFFMVFASTFPVLIPFVLFSDLSLAMRVSNGVALLMLFGCGYALGRYGGLPRLRSALAMTVIGAVLVSIIIALGG